MRFLLAILLLLVAAPASAQQGQGMSKAMVVSSCGGGTLPSGALTQLTMDPQGRLCQSGIGSNVCSQAAAYLARTTGGNEGGNAVNMTALICGLVSDGVIDGDLLTGKCGSHLDVFYVFAQQNRSDASLNICQSTYSLIPGASIIFASYVGFSNFATDVLQTGFVPGSAGGNYLQNNASFGLWAINAIPENIAQMGTVVATTSYLFDHYTDGFIYTNVNNAGGQPGLPSATKGLFVGDRSSSANVHSYVNGVDVGTSVLTSNTPDTASGFVVGNAYGGASAQTFSEAHIGGSLGATLNLALYNRLRTYMTAVGVP